MDREGRRLLLGLQHAAEGLSRPASDASHPGVTQGAVEVAWVEHGSRLLQADLLRLVRLCQLQVPLGSHRQDDGWSSRWVGGGSSGRTTEARARRMKQPLRRRLFYAVLRAAERRRIQNPLGGISGLRYQAANNLGAPATMKSRRLAASTLA